MVDCRLGRGKMLQVKRQRTTPPLQRTPEAPSAVGHYECTCLRGPAAAFHGRTLRGITLGGKD